MGWPCFRANTYCRVPGTAYGPRMRLLGTILLTLAVGLVTSLALFWSTVPHDGCCHRVGEHVVDPGYINPWTGESRPVMTTWESGSGTSGPVARENTSGPFIPLPVGFLVGSLLVVVLAIATGPPRKRRNAAVIGP